METGNIVKKRKFDKKKWREKKYSKGFRLNKWEEDRQKSVIRKYRRGLKKDNINSDTILNNMRPKQKRISGVKAAQLEYKRIVEEKQKKKEEKVKKEKEIQEALERYKKKRTDTYKKLSKKNKKGQPLMKERLELMFEKVKQCVGK